MVNQSYWQDKVRYMYLTIMNLKKSCEENFLRDTKARSDYELGHVAESE